MQEDFAAATEALHRKGAEIFRTVDATHALVDEVDGMLIAS
jgi:hypothetical protein